MKRLKYSLLLLVFITGCFEISMKNTELLDYNYWNYFNSCMKWVADPNYLFGKSGFYYDSSEESYLYNTGLIDTANNLKIDYIHYRTNNQITNSILTIGDQTYSIDWIVNSKGIIQKQVIYNSEKKFVDHFSYRFDLNEKADTSFISQGFQSENFVLLKQVLNYGQDQKLKERWEYLFTNEHQYQIEYYSNDSILLKTETFPLP